MYKNLRSILAVLFSVFNFIGAAPCHALSEHESASLEHIFMHYLDRPSTIEEIQNYSKGTLKARTRLTYILKDKQKEVKICISNIISDLFADTEDHFADLIQSDKIISYYYRKILQGNDLKAIRTHILIDKKRRLKAWIFQSYLALSNESMPTGLFSYVFDLLLEGQSLAAVNKFLIEYCQSPTGMIESPTILQKPTDVRVIVFGDGGSCDKTQYKVALAAKKVYDSRGCDFGILLGDNIYPKGPSGPNDMESFYNAFERPYKGLNFPFYVALGNHDQSLNALGRGDCPKKSDYSVNYTVLSPTKRWKMPSKYFRIQQQLFELIVLDSTPIWNGIGQKQMDEVSQWLKEPIKSTWRIIIGHHPYMSNGSHGKNLVDAKAKGRENNWIKFFDGTLSGSADIYICGHDHNRQWLKYTSNGTELIVNGGAGKCPAHLHNLHQTHFQSSSNGFIYIHIQDSTMTIDFYDDQANLEFSRSIKK